MSTFIIFGNLETPFPRMVDALLGTIDFFPTPIYIQAGGSAHLFPQNMLNVIIRKSFNHEEFETNLSQADVVITHGGIGSLSMCFSYSIHPGVFIRQKNLNEHIDDHQTDFYNYYSSFEISDKLEEKSDLIKFLLGKKFKVLNVDTKFPFGDVISMRKKLWNKIDYLLNKPN